MIRLLKLAKTRAVVASMVGLMGHAGVAYAAQAIQDVVITITGDRLVGEIIRVDKDVLTFSTGYSDVDFKIEWDKIASIESDRQFLVETFAGQRLSGALKTDPLTKAAVTVGEADVRLPDVSMVQPFERTFWSRFDVGLDFGYSRTKTNSAKQLSLGGNMSYRDERNLDSLFVNVFRSSQSNAPETQRWDLSNDFRHLLGARWFVNTGQDLLNSEEQGLDLRTTIGGGAGRYLLRSGSQYLAVGGGLAWTNENYTDATLPSENSAEAYIGTEFMTEKLKVTDLLTRFSYYPSLTISGRQRVNFRLDLDFNLPGDWYLRVGFFNNYDSRPPEGFSETDYGLSNTFGFRF